MRECARQGCRKAVSRLGPTLIVFEGVAYEVALCDADTSLAADVERRRHLVEIGTARAGRSLLQVLEDIDVGGVPIPPAPAPYITDMAALWARIAQGLQAQRRT
jgi:hypothetical protein